MQCPNGLSDYRIGEGTKIYFFFKNYSRQRSPTIFVFLFQLDIPIHVHNGDTALITLTAIGYDERIMGDTMAVSNQMTFAGVPSQQCVTVPGQTSFLSTERMSFGDVPLFSRSRQAIFVINTSPDHTVSFTWHVTNKQHRQVSE